MSGPEQATRRRRRGVDVSHHQRDFDAPTVRDAGIEVVIAKITEGVSYVDSTGIERVNAARVAGMATGLYHFLSVDVDPVRQAQHFVEAVGGDPAALPARILALDLEDESRRIWGSEVGERALAWLRHVEAALGVTPWVYLSPTFAKRTQIARTPALGAYPLWLAHWTSGEPQVPAPWSAWTAWQIGTGKVSGISGDVDLDWVWL